MSATTCPVCGRPGSCCAERDRYREALLSIAHGNGFPNPVDYARRVLRDERDRYRDALEEIADHDLTYPSAMTARAALDEKERDRG